MMFFQSRIVFRDFFNDIPRTVGEGFFFSTTTLDVTIRPEFLDEFTGGATAASSHRTRAMQFDGPQFRAIQTVTGRVIEQQEVIVRPVRFVPIFAHCKEPQFDGVHGRSKFLQVALQVWGKERLQLSEPSPGHHRETVVPVGQGPE